MKARYIILIDAVWTILWSTIIYLNNGEYPQDYFWWFIIVYVCVLLMPWIFIDQEGIDILMHDPAKDKK